ncbi:MAG: acyltransferase [Chthonomonas sp.]|nr:acyltransferase [Chthonomonas sp.]
MSESGKIRSIESLRGLAALYVALGHIVTMVDPERNAARTGSLPAWLAQVTHPMWYGHLAVAAFIVLSGFSLQLSLYLRNGDGQLKDLRRYLVRRCRRILPPYYACLAFSLLVCVLVTTKLPGLPFTQYLPLTAENVGAHLLLVHNFDPTWMYKVNGVLWSIAIEFQLYFAFPVLVWVLMRFGKLAVVTCTSVAAWLLILQVPGGIKLYFWYAALFALGMVAARMAMDSREEPPTHGVLMLCAGALFGASVWFATSRKDLWVADAFIGLAVAAVLIAITRYRGSWSDRMLGARPLVWLGSFSYSLYLMHHPLLQVGYFLRPEWAATPTRQTAWLLAWFPLVLLGCYGFYWVFERPFISSRRHTPSPEPITSA